MRHLIQKVIDLMKTSTTYRIGACILVSVVIIISGLTVNHLVFSSSSLSQVIKSKTKPDQKMNNNSTNQEKTKSFDKLQVVDWTKPSQQKAYPEAKTANDLVLDVNLKKQRVYVRNNQNKVVYTMYASSGMKESTPKGHFKIQEERGTDFYNPEEKMGANFYTSFHDHGVYLFHTVPTDIKGEYIKEEADLLGQRPSSHGCIRLSIPDAKWIFEKIPNGTKVYVH